LTQTRAQWEEELSNLDVCCEPVLSPEEVLNSPHFRERKMIIEAKEGDRDGTNAPASPNPSEYTGTRPGRCPAAKKAMIRLTGWPRS
jgi:crotonobetainyl-CoA:carnitine CoA-transferase CaiB-like acyl-CoA transferase